MMKYIDLSHKFVNDMPVYPGDPRAKLFQTSHLDTDGYTDFEIHSGLHVGTHIDAPLHMLQDGKKICDFPLDYFCGSGHLIDAREKQIEKKLLDNKNIKKGDIVFVLTGHDSIYHTPAYFEAYPEVRQDFAEELISLGVKMVGMDSPSPDTEPYDTHKLLLAHDILIIENLTHLDFLLTYPSFMVYAFPLHLDAEASPARVVAMVSDKA